MENKVKDIEKIAQFLYLSKLFYIPFNVESLLPVTNNRESADQATE